MRTFFARKSQNFSVDVVVVVVILLFVGVFFVANTTQVEDEDLLSDRISQQERVADDVVSNLVDMDILSVEDELDREKFKQLDGEKIKESFGVFQDICISFEEGGRVVNVTGEESFGKGSSSIIINGKRCS